MIYNLTVNGQKEPVSVDRSVCLKWQTDFDMKAFSIELKLDGNVVFNDYAESSVCFYEYARKLKGLTEYVCSLTCFGEGITEKADIVFRTALVEGFPKECKWIGAGSLPIAEQNFNGNPATYLYKDFFLEKIEKTYIHLAGLGLFVLRINGRRVSDDVLNCPFCNYDKTVLYANYNITDYLVFGRNTIEIILGDGWFNQTAKDEWDFYKAEWRDNAKAVVLVEGGINLCSDETWQCSLNGQIIASSIRLGERTDFSKDAKSSLSAAKIMIPPKGKLKSMQELPIRETELIDYESVKDFGECVQFDFNDSVTGYVELSAAFKGVVKIRYGDRLDEIGRIDNSSNGQYVYGGEYQTDVIIGTGEKLAYKPSFTYHAFRWVEIEGLDEIPSKDELKAVFIRSAFEKAGSFSCSNERLNKLYALSMRSLECNYTGFLTDCPHREKNGWTGDAQLSASVLIKNYRVADNLYKWLEDVCEAQTEDGKIPCIVPTVSWGYAWGNGPAWDYALFALPYELYLQTGEKHAIKLVFETCERYLNYLNVNAVDGLVELGLGDWNYPQNIKIDLCPLKLISSCYYYSMTRIVSVFARVIGLDEKKREFEVKADLIKTNIRNEFLVENGSRLSGMTALAAVIYFGIAENGEKNDFLNRLVCLIEKENYRALFGILGAKYVHNVLCEYGRQDVFVKMAECNEYPSFGLWLLNGATTLWEDFEGKNSRNHHMFADIASVIQTYLLGVKQEEIDGRYYVSVKPYLDNFDKMQGSVISVNGMVECSYKKSGEKIIVKIFIPYGVSAVFEYKGIVKRLKSGFSEFCVV